MRSGLECCSPGGDADSGRLRRRTVSDEHYGRPQPFLPIFSSASSILGLRGYLVILCRSGSAETALHHLREITSKLKLTMNEEKLRICRVPDASMRIFLSFQKQLPNRMPPPGVQGGTAHISGTGFTGLLPPTVACGFRGS